jgi:hypothetical protein
VDDDDTEAADETVDDGLPHPRVSLSKIRHIP